MADSRRAGPRPDVATALDLVVAELERDDALSAQSLPRVEAVAARFVRFAECGRGRDDLQSVDETDVRLFVEADTNDGPVSVATKHLRRSIVRLLFRTARHLQLVDGDPTLDLDLPRKSSLHTRPLDDTEVALCRSASLTTLTSTRLAAAWALAESSARTAEIPRLTIGDVDLQQRRVWIHGGGRTVPRWGELTEWGATQLNRHMGTLPDDPHQALVYRGAGSAESKQATACIVIGDVFARAGLGDEPDVRPLSVAAWAGRRVLEDTDRIEQVALRLGMRSLDRAARLIGHDWSAEQP